MWTGSCISGSGSRYPATARRRRVNSWTIGATRRRLLSDAFEMEIAVAPADIDGLGHVNNVVYVRWVQDIAVGHWRAVASAADQAKFLWIVVRHEIDYKQAARLGDTILARTWV